MRKTNPESERKLRESLLPRIEWIGKGERLLGFPTATRCADVIESNRTAAEKNEDECECGHGQRKFVSAIAHQSIVEVHFCDCDGKIDTDRKGRNASEQAYQNEQATKKFRERGKIGAPSRKPEAGDELNVVVKPAKNLVVPVVKHDGAECEAHD